jgi:hypothetical protein
MGQLVLSDLVGRKINSVQIDDEKRFLVLDTDKGPLYMTWSGDCCAHCYIAHFNGTEALINAEILSAEDSEWKAQSDASYEVIESMGTKLKTTKGYVDIETRLEHNGYYSGIIEIYDDANDYGVRFYSKKKKLKDLKDF